MAISWKNLRPLNGSQRHAFEELCCQLARYEQVPQGSKFLRKGTPDAGVECFWILPNGDELGWQAKFFQSSPTTGEWQQIDDSVKTALEKHPRLISYTVCLATDLSDARLEGQESSRQKWEKRLEKWQGWAEHRNMAVEFPLWGSHEILDRLSRDEHRGRMLFWFNEEWFSQNWFEERIKVAIANAGPRYTPELNIELPLARIFESLGYTSWFNNELKRLSGQIRRAYARVEKRNTLEEIADEIELLGQSIARILQILEAVDVPGSHPIDFRDLLYHSAQATRIAWGCRSSLEEAAEKKKQARAAGGEGQAHEYYRATEFDHASHDFYRLIQELDGLRGFVDSTEAHLANVPSFLLVGVAGTGKTHLFCDIAKNRITCAMPTVLLLGEHFVDSGPWSQIIEMLGSSCSGDEFLGALEAAAQAHGSRALILIDALNEGEGKTLWRKYLAGMLASLSQFPWVGIALSVRSSYEPTVLPPDLAPTKLLSKEHPGFAGHEYQAARTFFDFYHIEYPSVPILSPEFQNPLFLKLFCQGMQNKGLTKIPPGLHGITAMFSFFIESLNDKLHRPEYLNFDPHRQIVQRAVDEVVRAMTESGSAWLPYETASSIVHQVLPSTDYEKSLLRHLISEGLLSRDMHYEPGKEQSEGIRFTYERFADHMLVSRLLDQHLDTNSPEESFLTDTPLGMILKDEPSCWMRRGLVEALLIQLPERIGRELVDVAPQCAEFRPVREAFVESLIWRKRDAITDSTLKYVNQQVIRYRGTADQFLNALLTVAMDPEHPYNAEFLHRQLQRKTLADRDAWWSIFLHEQYGSQSAVDRLVDWAWSIEDKSHVLDKSVYLCGMALAWFLTTSNRFLRDRATKALVALFTPRIHVLRQLIPKFLEVNDPYVLERLFAVAYGCAMRSTDDEAVAELAQDTYDWIFRAGTPPPHVLLRDYARGVIENALQRTGQIDVDLAKIRPPYTSEWLEKAPSEDVVEEFKKIDKDAPEKEFSRWHLYDSVMGIGDFARYVIGTDHYESKWSSQRLGEPEKPSKRTYEAFKNSLTSRQERAWQSYVTLRKNVAEFKTWNQAQRKEVLGYPFTDKQFDQALSVAAEKLSNTLGKKKTKTFNELVLPYLELPEKADDDFPKSAMQRWIFQRVLELGWTVDRLGEFDRKVSHYSESRHPRTARKPERIAKKYQWIAYHELLARLCDNFKFKGDLMSYDWETRYDGPWQLHCRDIDPSFLLQKTKREVWQPHTNTWWFPPTYDAWTDETDHVTWLKDAALPAYKSLMEVLNPSDGSEWVCLQGYYNWEQASPPEEERFEKPRRRICSSLIGYIVKAADIDDLFGWAQGQDFRNRWLPESHHLYNTFLGEFFWSPAFSYDNSEYTDHHGWTRGSDKWLPNELLVPSIEYLKEDSGFDCSVDENINIYLPSAHLVEEMGLSWNGDEGRYYDSGGKLIAFDPSVREIGPGALLVRKESFMTFLRANEYDLLWIVRGEKNLIGGSMMPGESTGFLDITGVYRFAGNEIQGVVNTRFRS